MKFERTESFLRDFAGLHDEHKQLVIGVLPDFHVACERYRADPSCTWPQALRVRPMKHGRVCGR